jgi:hypothetical protein
MRVIAGVAVAAILASVPAAQAQVPRPGAEAGVRLRAVGPIQFDRMSADLTTADGRPYALFVVDNGLGPEWGVEAHVSVPVVAAVRVEGAVAFGQPTLRTHVSRDVEGADAVTVTDRIMRLTIEGAIVVQVRAGVRHAWFVRAGGGFSRGLTSDRNLLAKGSVATMGAGIKYWVRGGPRRRGGFGVDVEGRMAARWQGLTLDAERLHIVPAAVAGLFFGF